MALMIQKMTRIVIIVPIMLFLLTRPVSCTGVYSSFAAPFRLVLHQLYKSSYIVSAASSASPSRMAAKPS